MHTHPLPRFTVLHLMVAVLSSTGVACSLTNGDDHVVVEGTDPMSAAATSLLDGEVVACGEQYPAVSTAGGNDINAYSCLPAMSPTGSELTALFTCPSDGDVVVATNAANRYPVVAVLRDVGGAPDPTQCVAGNYYSTRFSCLAGEQFHVVLDHLGASTEVLTADLSVRCDAPDTEVDCTDGFDDDGDHLKDCGDPDCVGGPDCPIVQPVAPLVCGDTLVLGRTDAFGSTNQADAYSCTPSLSTLGREYTYVFEPAVTQQVVFTASNASRYPVLAVTQYGPYGCLTESCVAGSYYSTDFLAEAGKSYCLTVDTTTADASFNYNVSVVCPQPETELDCADQVDNDGDFATDCADEDCAEAPECGTVRCTAAVPIDCSTRRLAARTGDPEIATNILNDFSCIPNINTPNNEVIYELTTNKKKDEVLVTLSNMSGYAAVAVIEAPGPGDKCDTSGCLAGNYYNARFTTKNKVYYVVVEGTRSDDVSYELTVLCGDDIAATEDETADGCSNGYDEDGDFAIDCNDDDCAEECASANVCFANETVTCGAQVAGSTATESTDVVDNYPCAPRLTVNGSERGYYFVAESSGWVNFTLSDRTDYAAVAVIEDTGTCDPLNCVKAQYYSARTEVEAGKGYYVLVDGKDEDVASVDYTLNVICDPPFNESNCSDGIDNDGDAKADQADPDCG